MTEAELHAFAQPTPKPSLFSSKAEKQLNQLILAMYGGDNRLSATDVVARAKDLDAQFPSLMYPLNILTFLSILNIPEYDSKLIEAGMKLWAARENAFSDPLVQKYFSGIRPVVRICEGASASDVLTQQQFGFILVEVLQDHGKYDVALAILKDMQSSILTQISTADLLLSKKDYQGILDITNNIENIDDATLILLAFRGIAFREQGLLDASLECMKLALAKKSRTQEALHRAHFERAQTYIKMGKDSLARKDLEAILVDDSGNEEVRAAIANLKE